MSGKNKINNQLTNTVYNFIWEHCFTFKLFVHTFPLFFLGPQFFKIHICKKNAHCYFPVKYSSRKLACVSLVSTSIWWLFLDLAEKEVKSGTEHFVHICTLDMGNFTKLISFRFLIYILDFTLWLQAKTHSLRLSFISASIDNQWLHKLVGHILKTSRLQVGTIYSLNALAHCFCSTAKKLY